MAQSLKERYSKAEYLALEEASGYKSEYYHGQIFVMAGGSLNHSRICGNVHNLLNN